MLQLVILVTTVLDLFLGINSSRFVVEIARTVVRVIVRVRVVKVVVIAAVVIMIIILTTQI